MKPSCWLRRRVGRILREIFWGVPSEVPAGRPHVQVNIFSSVTIAADLNSSVLVIVAVTKTLKVLASGPQVKHLVAVLGKLGQAQRLEDSGAKEGNWIKQIALLKRIQKPIHTIF